MSGDLAWRDLTAVAYHWHTQPLPMPAAWLMAQLPGWCQKAMTAGVFVFELFVPCLIFGPRTLRLAAAVLCAGFQLLIAATGNYTFFNFLTAALCLLLVDDGALKRIGFDGLGDRLVAATTSAASGMRGAVVALVVAPYQPRLDWQMWFAALSDCEHNPWFAQMMYRLLSGTPEVLALFQTNPFPEGPPRFVRAVGYDYDFTDLPELLKTGRFWRRTLRGVYFPPVSL